MWAFEDRQLDRDAATGVSEDAALAANTISHRRGLLDQVRKALRLQQQGKQPKHELKELH
jgi:hypothetical protein